jgi:ferredoxin-NADP reductase
MSNEQIFSQIEGYTQVQQDIATCRKYGKDMNHQLHLVAELVERLHPKRLVLKVSDIINEAESVKTVRLVRYKGQLPPFEAGQYINISVDIQGIVTSRPYSLSSAPSQTAFYDVTIKRKDGGFVSNYLLDTLRVGDTLESSAPAGEFHYNPLFHGDDLVMLAGGSGITPIMSMIRHFCSRGSDKRIRLIYVCRTPEEIIYKNELEGFASHYNNFAYTSVISRPKNGYKGITGHLTGDLINSLVQDITEKTFYICGPTGMCDAANSVLLGSGVKPRKIRRENFGESADVTQNPDWPAAIRRGAPIEISVIGRSVVEAKAGEPLLNALDAAGITVPANCRSGECSLCRVKLLRGSVFQKDGSKERASDKKYGYIHSCCAYPTGDIEIAI